jgi:hypothetical protein
MGKYDERKIEKIVNKLFELRGKLDEVLDEVTEKRKQHVDDFLGWLLGMKVERDVETGTTYVVPKSTVCPKCAGSFTYPATGYDEEGPYGSCEMCGWAPESYEEMRDAFLNSRFYKDKLKG